jgi:catechol 2,3-dioxygenase-like lactoylglutathione lyase family enzyme
MDKQQFNVYLPPDLVRQVKMRSLELDESLSTFVESALNARLHHPESTPAEGGSIEALPIVYVTDMDASLAFYRALGFEPQHVGSTWSVVAGAGTQLALHGATPGAQRARPLELAASSRVPLEEVVARATEHGLEIVRGIADEAFGRSLVVRDPDGLDIQVNEHL